MKPMNDIEAKIFAAKYAYGAFSYYNSKRKICLTVAYYSGDKPMLIEQEAAKVLQKALIQETAQYIIKHIPMLSYDQINVLSDNVREMLRH